MAEPENSEDTQTHGCQHYKRQCAFVSPCCKKVYTCRVCHDEKERHQINRHLVQQIQCLQCQHVQAVQKECEKCGVCFGKYFCGKCRLFDDTDRGQFHCEPCGICRIGGEKNFFHCSKCDSCLGLALKDDHKCIEKGTRSNCPICLEDLHTSRNPIDVPRCGHFIHKDCLRAMMKMGKFACPICGESYQNMETLWKLLDAEIVNTPMPDEYKDFHVQILCKDCHKESRTLFHVIGLKCADCGSYNTCRAAEPDVIPEEAPKPESPSVTGASNQVATDPPSPNQNPSPAAAANHNASQPAAVTDQIRSPDRNPSSSSPSANQNPGSTSSASANSNSEITDVAEDLLRV